MNRREAIKTGVLATLGAAFGVSLPAVTPEPVTRAAFRLWVVISYPGPYGMWNYYYTLDEALDQWMDIIQTTWCLCTNANTPEIKLLEYYYTNDSRLEVEQRDII